MLSIEDEETLEDKYFSNLNFGIFTFLSYTSKFRVAFLVKFKA